MRQQNLLSHSRQAYGEETAARELPVPLLGMTQGDGRWAPEMETDNQRARLMGNLGPRKSN